MVSYTSSLPEINKNITIRNYFNKFSNTSSSNKLNYTWRLVFLVRKTTNQELQIQITKFKYSLQKKYLSKTQLTEILLPQKVTRYLFSDFVLKSNMIWKFFNYTLNVLAHKTYSEKINKYINKMNIKLLVKTRNS